MDLVLVSVHELCTSRHILGMYSLFGIAQQLLYMEAFLPIGLVCFWFLFAWGLCACICVL